MGILVLYVQPGARQTRVSGMHDGKPKIQLKAPPVDGRANDALMAFLAERCGRPKAAVRIVSGETSRTKRVEVDGLTDGELLAVVRADVSSART